MTVPFPQRLKPKSLALSFTPFLFLSQAMSNKSANPTGSIFQNTYKSDYLLYHYFGLKHHNLSCNYFNSFLNGLLQSVFQGVNRMMLLKQIRGDMSLLCLKPFNGFPSQKESQSSYNELQKTFKTL